MTNVESDQPTKFLLMMERNIEMLRPDHIDKEISKMSENTIGHRKGLQKKTKGNS